MVGVRVSRSSRPGPLRRIQHDPELAGVGAVVLDEVHVGDPHADLTLALSTSGPTCATTCALVAMSATIEAERTAALLDRGGAPVVRVPGALHPVETVWCPLPAAGARRTDDRGITPAFHDHVAATVRRALAAYEGDVLVFVPGVAEVDATVRRLAGVDAAVHALHGRLPAAEQDRALSEGPRRRVIVSTAVAESSLTVPGVRVVVDAGFSREPRTDHRRGLASLVTVAVSRAGAEQRAGRAGRLGPGTVLRCWSEAEHAHLSASPGARDRHRRPDGLRPGGGLLGERRPRPGAARPAAGARPGGGHRGAGRAGGDDRGRDGHRAGPGDRGRAGRSQAGARPVDGAGLVGATRAAEVVAMLSEDVRAPGGDLVAALRVAAR